MIDTPDACIPRQDIRAARRHHSRAVTRRNRCSRPSWRRAVRPVAGLLVEALQGLAFLLGPASGARAASRPTSSPRPQPADTDRSG